MNPAGRHVLVLGLGRFSGGVETVRFLAGAGADVLVSDAAPRETLEASAAEAEALGARLVFGTQTPDLLEDRDLVVANPAIPFDHPLLLAADARRLPVTTEVNLFLERVRAPVFGVTGTKGKSTTATILARMLEAAGRRVHLGGNVGRALLGMVDAIDGDDLVVLELSSFQLHWTRRIGRAPHVTIVTNLFGDHLDRHGTFAAYAESKRAALDYQGAGDVAVLPADDDDVARAGYLGGAGRGRRVLYGDGGAWRLVGERVLGPEGVAVDLGGMSLWGAHNRRNALAAAAAAAQVEDVGAAALEAGARAARPLPHRLAPVAEVRGVLYVDDSNATNPTSTLRAIEACPRRAVLIVGGRDKGLDAAPLLQALAARARGVVGVGTTGPALVRALAGCLPVEAAVTMAEAVRAAAALARPGDAVLLSPAYSSLDEWASFVARGKAFQAAVRALAAAPTGPEGTW